MKSPWDYFTLKEAHGLVPNLMFKLDRARALYGHPIIITSGFRTPEQNDVVNGVQNSAHLTGQAADIRMPEDSLLERKLIWALGRAGFERVFLYSSHIHVDTDGGKTSPAFGSKQYA